MINIQNLAKLANLPIDDTLAKKLQTQLESTIQHVESLQQLDTKQVKPTFQVTGLENITREDTPRPSFTQAEAIRNAKKIHNGFFIVDAVLDAD